MKNLDKNCKNLFAFLLHITVLQVSKSKRMYYFKSNTSFWVFVEVRIFLNVFEKKFQSFALDK